MKEISLDMVRVTEAAAIAASGWIGSGDKKAADKAATEAMRERLGTIAFSGKIVIGEGIKDESAGLFAGERVGKGGAKDYDIAVDPIEGTRPTVQSGPEALSVLAVAEKECLASIEEFYMNKLCYGPALKSAKILISDPLEKNIRAAAAATGKKVSQITVCMLDRPRHEGAVAKLREIGARIKLIQDCDVSAAIAACMPDSGIDLLMGVGGSPEGVIAACAIKCLGGDFQAQIVAKDGSIRPEILSIHDLVRGECAFAATGITDGSLLRGVRYTAQGPATNSVFMRSSSGTVRWLSTRHGN
jgi:fructose-1,6-bisphosphatase II